MSRRRPAAGYSGDHAPNAPVCDHACTMPCFAALLALIGPRVALIGVALFSNILSRAFDSWFLPLIGFIILPWTTLAYAIMWDIGTHRVDGFEWFVVVLAFVIDVASYLGGRAARD